MSEGFQTSRDASTALVMLRARWLATMAGPMVEDGAVIISEGKVVATGLAKDLHRTFSGLSVRDFGDAVIVPGLVNAHIHLELSDLTPPRKPMNLADWLSAIVKQSPPPGEAGRQRISAATHAGIDESLRFGVTCVGDISNRCAITREILAGRNMLAVSFGEVLAMAGRRHLLAERLAGAADCSGETARLRIGVSPHSPYSVESTGYAECFALAVKKGLPLATHLAESAGEAEFLEHGAGPLRELWNRIGGWDESVPRFVGGPIRFAESLGLLAYAGAVLAHVNYCDDLELDILARGKASVVVCPRTHDYFAHPPHRWQEMLARGVNIAVGTDSKGSSPDLDLVDDLRLMRQWSPETAATDLWELATTRGARALGLSPAAGVIAPGRDADLAVFPSCGDHPLDHILDTPHCRPTSVFCSGVECSNS